MAGRHVQSQQSTSTHPGSHSEGSPSAIATIGDQQQTPCPSDEGQRSHQPQQHIISHSSSTPLAPRATTANLSLLLSNSRGGGHNTAPAPTRDTRQIVVVMSCWVLTCHDRLQEMGIPGLALMASSSSSISIGSQLRCANSQV